MNKALSRTITLIGLGVLALGFILIPSAALFYQQAMAADIHQQNDIILSILTLLSSFLVPASFMIIAIGWIGALIRTAQLARWGWFVCLLLLGFFPLLVYIFIGPTTSTLPVEKQPL